VGNGFLLPTIASPDGGPSPLTVTFAAYVTPNNCIGTVSFAWFFGDGSSSVEQTPSHTYTSAGSYEWTLTA
jgi:PKD repeat protein